MLCSLLQVFKLYFITTSLFTSNSSVYMDRNHKPVAITHEVSHPSLNTHYEFVILRNPAWRECFLDHEGVILSTPTVGLEVWKDHMKPTPAVARGTFAPITIKEAPRSSIRPITRTSNVPLTRPPPPKEEED